MKAILLVALLAIPALAPPASAGPPCEAIRVTEAGVTVTVVPGGAWCGGPSVTVDACALVESYLCYVTLP